MTRPTSYILNKIILIKEVNPKQKIEYYHQKMNFSIGHTLEKDDSIKLIQNLNRRTNDKSISFRREP